MKFLASLCLTCALVTLSAPAADWPQWQGPTRDNISTEKGLLGAFPAGGPKLVWQFTECGVGYGSPSIVGDKLYLAGTEGKNEVLLCLDAKTGKRVWQTPAVIGAMFGNPYGDGPRSSPAVDGEFVYALGGQGDLVCFEAGTGKAVWKKSLTGDLGGKMMTGWGYSESPLVDGDLVLCSPGGGQGTLAALNKKTGEVVWRSKEITDPASYSSIIVAEFAGVRQYIQITGSAAGSVIGVEAKTGKLLWRVKDGAPVNGIATCTTPIYHDGLVYATSDYNAGSALIKLKKSGAGVAADLVYSNKEMQNHHGGIALIEGHVYGCKGNKGGGGWACQNLLTGKEVWSDKKSAEGGSLTVADGKLFLYGQNTGTLVLVDPAPQGFKELGRFPIPAQTKLPRNRGLIWAHPVVANGKLYLRDLDLLYCFDIAAK